MSKELKVMVVSGLLHNHLYYPTQSVLIERLIHFCSYHRLLPFRPILLIML